jgi:hypothetical protein
MLLQSQEFFYRWLQTVLCTEGSVGLEIHAFRQHHIHDHMEYGTYCYKGC